MKPEFGELKHLDLRTIWPSESRAFTPWLADNIQALGQVLGMDLEVTATEATVGDFAVDILAKDLSTGRVVVVENQYGATDHDHLGKLLTYASGMDAFTLVWIAEAIRDEHRQALEWLNERTDAETMFFAIVLEVLQIDQSSPAFNFKSVVSPNRWQKSAHQGGAAPSARSESYRQFFQQLVDELRENHKFTGARVAFPQNWFSFASGVSGFTYGASFAQGNRVRIELFIDRGETDENKNIFDRLLAKRESIEASLGYPLEWERLDERRGSRIAVYRSGSIESDEATLESVRKWIIEQLLAFKKVFVPLLKQYGKNLADT